MQEIVEEKNRHNLGVSDDFSDAYGEEEIVQEVEDSHNYFAESPVAHTIQERGANTHARPVGHSGFVGQATIECGGQLRCL